MEVLLKNETYIGRLVQKDWQIKEQAHEPLVEKDIFEQAQNLRKKIHERNKNSAVSQKIEENVFEDIFFCGVCGRKMTRHSHVKTFFRT